MSPQFPAPRRAIVLGGGGVLGFAWMLGALSALESVAGFDVHDVETIVGTSAGSVAAGLLGCGMPLDAILARGTVAPRGRRAFSRRRAVLRVGRRPPPRAPGEGAPGGGGGAARGGGGGRPRGADAGGEPPPGGSARPRRRSGPPPRGGPPAA